MAIRIRNGDYEDFDTTKLVQDEIAIVNSGDPNTVDGKSMYIGFGSGNAKRVPFADEGQSGWEAEDTGNGNVVITMGGE